MPFFIASPVLFFVDASGNHVVTNCYPPDLEDFAGFNIMQLDTWVFQQVQVG